MPIDHVVYPWEQTLYDVLHGSLSFVMEVADMFLLHNTHISCYEKSWFYSIDGRLILIPDGTLIDDVKGFPLHISYVNHEFDAGAIVRQIRPIANVRTRSISGFECVSTVRTARPFMFYESHAPSSSPHTFHVIDTHEHRIVTCTMRNISSRTLDRDLPNVVKQLMEKTPRMVSGHRLDESIVSRKLFLVHRAVLRSRNENVYKLSIPTSISEFRIADEDSLKCAPMMRRDYAFFMDVSGDGDCFYRAFFIGVFVTSLRVHTKAPFQRVINICRWYLRHHRLQISGPTSSSLLETLRRLEVELAHLYDSFNSRYLSINFMNILYYLHSFLWNKYDADVIVCLRHAIGSSLMANRDNLISSELSVMNSIERVDPAVTHINESGRRVELRPSREISFNDAIREIFTVREYAENIFPFVAYLFECPFRVLMCTKNTMQPEPVLESSFPGSRLNACHVELANEGRHYYILIPKVITEIPARPLTGANPYQGYYSHR
jgi:hypothetical protein